MNYKSTKRLFVFGWQILQLLGKSLSFKMVGQDGFYLPSISSLENKPVVAVNFPIIKRDELWFYFLIICKPDFHVNRHVKKK